MTFTEGAENQGREEGSAAALELSAPGEKVHQIREEISDIHLCYLLT